MLDWVISGGKIIDGTLLEPLAADVGLNGERIASIGDLRGQSARNTLNAQGCYVCPGFIDAHSHSDAFLLNEPSAPSKIYQGITTEIIGNCGASAAPITSKANLPFDWQRLSYPGEWQSMREYLRLLEQCRPAVNVVPLAGHNRIRIAVMGFCDRPASVDELRKMKRLLEESLEAGAWGLSTGLIYRPGKYASDAEIKELAGIAARRNGIYTTHLRSEKSRLLESIAEAIDVGRQTGIRVEISHLKTASPATWHSVDDAIAMIAKAREDGIDVAADRYPYIFSCTDLDILLPDWLAADDREDILKRLQDKKTREKLLYELSGNHSQVYWEGIIVSTSSDARWRGRSILRIANDWKIEPAEAVIKILETDGLQTQAFYEGMNEDNMWKILSQPFVMIGTDASGRVPPGLFAGDHPHPRAYGSFTKFLRSALDGKTVPLGEAVRKMTSLPADHFRIKQRGRLAVGNMADIVVFEPATVKDLATYEHPHQLSVGMRSVMVNGELVIAENRLTGNRPGRILTP